MDSEIISKVKEPDFAEQLKKYIEHTSEKLTPKEKIWWDRIVPGSDNYYKIKIPFLRKISAKIYTKLKNNPEFLYDFIDKWWELGIYRTVAFQIIEKIGKNNPEKAFEFFTKYDKDINNWAVNDGLCSSMKYAIEKTPQLFVRYIETNINHESEWIRRCAIVTGIYIVMKKPEYAEKMTMLVEKRVTDSEIYIKKAIAWYVSQLGKRNRKLMDDFIEKYGNSENKEIKRTIGMCKTSIKQTRGILPK